MDPAIAAWLIQQGPIGGYALIASVVVAVLWRRLEKAEAANDLAATALKGQELINVKSEGKIDRLTDRLEDCQRDRDLCEQRASQPRKEPSV